MSVVEPAFGEGEAVSIRSLYKTGSLVHRVFWGHEVAS
jgi:hypothetical protein